MTDWLIDHAPTARHALVFNLALGLFFVALIPPSVLLWSESVAYIVALSVGALIVGQIAAVMGSLAQLAAEGK